MLSVYPLSVNKTLMQENNLKKNNAREYENKSNFFRIHDAIFKQNSILKHIRKKEPYTCPIRQKCKRFIAIYNLDSPVFSGVAFFDFLEETGVLEADSLALFFPCSTFKTKSKR
jgi:hypothetical protein